MISGSIKEEEIDFLNDCQDLTLDQLEIIKKEIIIISKEMNNIIKKDCNKKTRDRLWKIWADKTRKILYDLMDKYGYISMVAKILDINLKVWKAHRGALSERQKGQVLTLNNYVNSYEDLLDILNDMMLPLLVQLSKIKERIIDIKLEK